MSKKTRAVIICCVMIAVNVLGWPTGHLAVRTETASVEPGATVAPEFAGVQEVELTTPLESDSIQDEAELAPTGELEPEASIEPTEALAEEPTTLPIEEKPVESTEEQAAEATLEPTEEPAPEATFEMTEEPASEPTLASTEELAPEPTLEPTEEPASEPVLEPIEEPTTEGTFELTEEPAAELTLVLTEEPTPEPTLGPTDEPALEPTPVPTEEPALAPTTAPTGEPTAALTTEPTEEAKAEATREATTEPEAETINEVEDTAAAVAESEPVASPTPETTPEPAPFAQGYVQVKQTGAKVFPKANAGSEALAVMSRGDKLWVSSRYLVAQEASDKDWLLCHFDTQEGLRSGYMRVSDLSPLTQQESQALVDQVRAAGTGGSYGGHPLPRLDCQLIESTLTPSPLPATEPPQPVQQARSLMEISQSSTDAPLQALETEATEEPGDNPTTDLTQVQTAEITVEPIVQPARESTQEPSTEPVPEPTTELAPELTVGPTEETTVEPALEPTPGVTAVVTLEPTAEPIAESAEEPAQKPSAEPTPKPSVEPTEEPAQASTVQPVQEPTHEPSGIADAEHGAAFTEPDVPEAPPSPYQLVFEGGEPPATISASETGVLWQSGGGIMMRARSSVQALSVAYLTYTPEPILAGRQATITVHAEGGDGQYRYKLVLYYNEDPSGEYFHSQPALPFSHSPVFDYTFDQPGYYMIKVYVEDYSGAQLVWTDSKFLVTTAADYSNPSKVAGKVAELAVQCKGAASTPYERALWLHDWLTANADYDESLTIYKPEGVLLLGSGVCDSYARAYQMLLGAVGIPCLYVTHEAGNHAWNLVQLDGHWYHVDVTWDDPVGGGEEDHEYFLVSDDYMRQDSFVHSYWEDSGGKLPACPYNWGEAPVSAPTPAPTAVVDPNPQVILLDDVEYTIVDGLAYVSDHDLPYGVSLAIPGSVQGFSVQGVLDSAFAPKPYVPQLSSLMLPDSLRSIGAEAFLHVRVPGMLTIPAGIAYIGTSAFSGMADTTSIQVAAGNKVFASRDGVLYSADMTRLVQYPAGNPASSFTVPSTVTHIADGAFAYCPNLREIHTSNREVDGSVRAFSGSDVTIYGLQDTPMQASFMRYGNPPSYVVVDGGAAKLPATVTITQDLSQYSTGLPVPIPSYEATGDGEVRVDFYSLGARPTLLEAPPHLPGNYKVVVTQYEGVNYGYAKAEQMFTIRKPSVDALFGHIVMNTTQARLGEAIIAQTEIGGGYGPPYYIVSSYWTVVVNGQEVVIESKQSDGKYTHVFTEGSSAWFSFTFTDGYLGNRELISDVVTLLPAVSPSPTNTTRPVITLTPVPLLHGDANADGSVTLADLEHLMDYLVTGAECKSMTNANADELGVVEMADALWLINRLVGE